MPRARERLPVDEERYGVFGLGNAIERLSRRDTRSSAGHNPSGDCLPLEEPTTDVDVMR